MWDSTVLSPPQSVYKMGMDTSLAIIIMHFYWGLLHNQMVTRFIHLVVVAHFYLAHGRNRMNKKRSRAEYVGVRGSSGKFVVVLFLFLLPTASAAGSESEGGAEMLAAGAVATGLLNSITHDFQGVKVSPPILKVNDETTLDLPLPKDVENFNYTRREVIEMSMNHNKSGVLKAIVEWGTKMKCAAGLEPKKQKFGPGSSTMKKFFPRKNEVYSDEVVDELLSGLMPGSDEWHVKVNLIVGCKDYGPEKSHIYSRYNVDEGVDDNDDDATDSQQAGPPCVTPPILELRDQTTLDLPLPKDVENYNYTRREVIEMSMNHNKSGVLKAIVEWGTKMKRAAGLEPKKQKFGPGSSTMKKFFPRKNEVYSDEVVDELLSGLMPGSDEWHVKVNLIVGCKDYGPEKSHIYSRYNVDEGVDDNDDDETDSQQAGPPCVTPESSHATTPGGSTAQAFSFSQSPQPGSADQANVEDAKYLNGNEWTDEEKAFAQRLIDEFKLGIIPIPHKTKLTDFLVATLHCSANRISRKYGRSDGIGQTPRFIRSPSYATLSCSEMDEKVTTLRGLEEGFFRSKFDSVGKQRPGSIFGKIPIGIGECASLLQKDGASDDTILLQLLNANPEFCTVASDTGLVGNLKRWPIIWSILMVHTYSVSGGNEVVATMPTLIESEEVTEQSNDHPRQARNRSQVGETSILNNFVALKDHANSLDFEATPRKSRDGSKTIPLHDKKLPTPQLRSRIILLCDRVMNKMGVDAAMKPEVEDLVSKILFYDHGYKSVKGNKMDTWRDRLDDAFLTGLTEDVEPLQGTYKGKKGLADEIESTDPGMMRKLFRHAQETLGTQAPFKELAEVMTEYAATDEIGNKEWTFSQWIVNRWFNKMGGKFKSCKPKPYLTEDQKRGRKQWCIEQKKKLESVEQVLAAEQRGDEESESEGEEEHDIEEIEALGETDTANLDAAYIECSAELHCCIPCAPLPPTCTCRKCFNCGLDMHEICGIQWDELLSSGYEVSPDSLSERGLSFFGEEHASTRIDICFKCCKDVTGGLYEVEANSREFYAVYVDEKWFFVQSGRNKIRELPLLPGEKPLPKPKTISRRNSCKVMFLGAVANPIPERNFDGKIYLERISKTETYKKMTPNQNFSHHAPTNELLKKGDWRKHVSEGMTLQTFRSTLQEKYDLEDSIAERLVIQYYISGRDGKQKCAYVDKGDSTVPSEDNLALGGYTLKVQYKRGDTREVDISCDSAFMLGVMRKVGQAIRDKYYWVSLNWPIFLYLDNAGGHGTKEAVLIYVTFLKTEFNVICVHQRPRSPETNMLDLGVWMALQSVVGKMHHRKRHHVDALACTVVQAWEALDEVKIGNVYNRWKLVLDLIIEDDGGNEMVESRRGKLLCAPSSEVESLEQVLPVDQSSAEEMAADQEEISHDEDIEEDNDCWDEFSDCCAGQHCLMADAPVSSTHTCLNCGHNMHGICGVEWSQLSSSGYDISKSSLTAEGRKHLDEVHNMNDICFRCCKHLTKTN